MITVIGLGNVGIGTFKEVSKIRKDVVGVDVNKLLVEELKLKGFNVATEIPISEAYIICVYTTNQVLDVINKISKNNHPLVVIESTIIPGTYQKLKSDNFDLVIFPHRFNPNDPEHYIFNLDRVIGGDEQALSKAREFYKEFMPLNLIHETSGEIAELCKPLENAYRFVEIALAEEIKILCDEQGINFEELRKMCNTKWNINIKEARDGIGGACLPKDIDIIDKFFENNVLFREAIKRDGYYKSIYGKK